jgi:hypothetical protein
MARPLAASEPVTGLTFPTATESFLSAFRPTPQGTIRFPEVHAVRLNDQTNVVVRSGRTLTLAPDNVAQILFTENLLLLDAGRILIEKGRRDPRASLKDHPLEATVRRAWQLSSSLLYEELDFPTDVAFEDGFPAREIPARIDLKEQESARRPREPLMKIAVEFGDTRSHDHIEVSQSYRGAERSVTVFHSEEEGLRTFYDLQWKGPAVMELQALLRFSEASLQDLGRQIAAVIGASGLYESHETESLTLGSSGSEFWIRTSESGKPSAFCVEGRSEENDDTLVVRLNPPDRGFEGRPMPLPPSLQRLLWSGLFDLTD